MIENKSASTNLRCQQPTGSTRITQNYCILMQAAYQTILAKVKIKSFIIKFIFKCIKVYVNELSQGRRKCLLDQMMDIYN